MRIERYEASFSTKKREFGGSEDKPKEFGRIQFLACYEGSICIPALAYKRASLTQANCELLDLCRINFKPDGAA